MHPGALRGIGRAALSIALSTLVVKLMAIGKDVVVARNLGISMDLDAFILAFNALGLFINVLLGMAPAALIPIYMRLKSEDSGEEAAKLAGWVTLMAISISSLLAAILYGVAPGVIRAVGPGLTEQGRLSSVNLFRALLPLLVTGAVSAFLGALMNASERFALPALLPGVTALAIMGLLLLYPSLGVWSLVYGSLLGGAVESGLLWVLNHRKNRLVFLKPQWSTLKNFLLQYAPMVSGGLLMSSTLLVDFGVASYLPAGSVSMLSYANKIPMALVAFSSGALGTAALPYLAKLVAEKDWFSLRKVVNTYLGWTWWVSSLGLIPLLLGSHGLVALLYQRGAFGPEQSVQVGFIQAMYFLQIPFYLAGILLVRLISALGKNQILLLGTLLSAGLNFGLDLGLLRIMGLPGIALSTSIVYGVSFFFLWGWAKHLMRRAEANQ